MNAPRRGEPLDDLLRSPFEDELARRLTLQPILPRGARPYVPIGLFFFVLLAIVIGLSWLTSAERAEPIPPQHTLPMTRSSE